jgi:TolB protein
MRSRLALLVVLLTMSAACSRTGDREEAAAPTTSTSTPTTTSAATTTVPDAAPTGRLAVLDGFEVVVMAADGSRAEQVTRGDVAFQPVWSPDGRELAWSYLDGPGGGIATMGGLRVDLGGRPFYTSWAPDGSRIAYMRPSSETGIEFGLVDAASGSVDHRHGGQPYYVAWAPDSSGMLRHVGDSLEETGLGPGGDDLGVPARFQAPSWAGGSQAYALGGPEGSRLVVRHRDGRLTEVATFDGFVVFLLSPDGSRLAYQVLGETSAAGVSTARGPLPSAGLRVFDIASRADTGVAGLSFGFFWDRAGDRLLYLTLAGEASLQWHVWDGTSTVDLDVFAPSQVFVSQYLPFFDQYAGSHRLWSPEGDAFVFAGTVGARNGIWVRLLDAPAATWVAEGDVAFWG